LEELSDWLRQEPGLRGRVEWQAAAPGPGQLGALAEVLVAAVGGGGAVSVLASSLMVFLSQPRHADVRIVVSGPDGRWVEVDAKRVGDAEALVRSVVDRAP
jgi:hypothetical protein